jgi:uncharacterized protein YdhG (YjbR/CyaY superfamily)
MVIKIIEKFTTHEAYLKKTSVESRIRLEEIQQKVEALLPDVSRCISYNMPAFKTQGVFIYFAAFKNHIGVYPPVKNDKILIKDLKPFRNEKGNLLFPLSEPLPLDIIGRVAIALLKEYKQK